eukprot:6167962-Karenia_brevis.AAC.1
MAAASYRAPDFKTTDHQEGHTGLNVRNWGQEPRPDLARDNPGLVVNPQGSALARRHEKIKWHTMLTGWPPPLPTSSTSLMPITIESGEHAAQASQPQKRNEPGANPDDWLTGPQGLLFLSKFDSDGP